MTEVDVIVVGAGGSGLAAAARSAELGMSVVVLEKQAHPGGTTGIAVGSFTANRTSHQKRAGIDDSLEHHAVDAGRFATAEIESRNNSELRRFFLSHCAETFEWLKGMGLSFHGPSPEPPNRVPRMHNVVPNAKAYIAALQARIIRNGGSIVCDAAVRHLTRNGDRVSGVRAVVAGTEVTYAARRAVILAAGDYANSTEIITRFKGEEFAVVDGINPHAQGDGHRLAEDAGARLSNMDVTYGPELRLVSPPSKHGIFTQLLPTSGLLSRVIGKLLPFVPRAVVHSFIKQLLVTWQHPEDSLFKEGAILVNKLGMRFCDEQAWPERELAVARQPDKTAFILLDETLIQSFSEWPNFISTAPEIAYAYVDDYLRLRPDVAVSATSLDAIAIHRRIDPSDLRTTVESLNSERSHSDGLRVLAGNKWVLLGPLKAYFTTTEGGAAITKQFEVLNDCDETIPGLYAVGQNGLGGQILWGHGLHIAWAMTSGRMVADHLERLARPHSYEKESSND